MRKRRQLTTPAYVRIERDLRQQINEGLLPLGSVLPSRRDLARSYDVDLTTLQRAIAPLLLDGTLCAQPRKGTVVARASMVTQPAAPAIVRTAALLGVIARYSPAAHKLEEIDDYWQRIILSSLERHFSAAGGASDVLNCDSEPYARLQIADVVTNLIDRGADVLVIAFAHDGVKSLTDALAIANARRVPAVVVTSEPIDRPIPHVYYDQYSAGYMAAEHLINGGYESVKFFSPFNVTWSHERLLGVRGAVDDLRFPRERVTEWLNDHSVVNYGIDQEGLAYAFAKVCLKSGLRPEHGVIAVNDNSAAGFQRAATELGLRSGTDYGLIGFDDLPTTSSRGISSMRPPLEALGEEASRLALRLLSGDNASIQVRLRSHLIARSSTRRA